MYLLFMGENYYPKGGWEDYVGCYEDMNIIKMRIMADNQNDWFNIVKNNKMIIKGFKINNEWYKNPGEKIFQKKDLRQIPNYFFRN
jgi:hypothetical protein